MSTNYTNIPGDLGGGGGGGGGTVTGTGTATQIAVWDSATNITSYAGLQYDDTILTLSVDQADAGNSHIVLGSLSIDNAGGGDIRFLVSGNERLGIFGSGSTKSLIAQTNFNNNPNTVDGCSIGFFDASGGTGLSYGGDYTGNILNNTEAIVLSINHTALIAINGSAIEMNTGLYINGPLGVGNSVAATTPGNVQNKIEIFNELGVSLGFIAVYDAIT